MDRVTPGREGRMSGHDHNHGHADAWHHHDASEGAPQAEHGSSLQIPVLARGLGLIAVSTLGLVGITMLYLNHQINQLHRERADADLSADYLQYRDAAKARLDGYGWVDASTVRVPVEMAKDRVLKKYAGR